MIRLNCIQRQFLLLNGLLCEIFNYGLNKIIPSIYAESEYVDISEYLCEIATKIKAISWGEYRAHIHDKTKNLVFPERKSHETLCLKRESGDTGPPGEQHG